MYKLPIKGGIPPKPSPKPQPELGKTIDSVMKVTEDLKILKKEVEVKIDSKIEEVDKTITSVEKRTTEAISSVQDVKQQAIEHIKSLTPKDGVDGNDGEPGIDAKPVDEQKIIESVLSKIPDPQIIDEKKLISKLLKALPENKASLKIIQEKIEFDPMSVIEKIMALPEDKFKIKSSQVTGLQQTIDAFRSQLSRGYLHGGGDTVVAGSGISITKNTNGTKTIAAMGGFTNPMTTLGDIIFENATPAPDRLAGNATTIHKFLRQIGTGAVSAAPSWQQVDYSEIANTPAIPTPGGSQYDVQTNDGAGGFTGDNGFVYNGNVGIGTNAPGFKLTVGTGSNPNVNAQTYILAQDSNTNDVRMGVANSDVGVFLAASSLFAEGVTTGIFAYDYAGGVNATLAIQLPGGLAYFSGPAGFGGVTNPLYGIDNYGTANFNTTTGGVPNIQVSGNGTAMGYFSAISEAGTVGTNPSDALVGDIVIQNLGAGAARILFAAYNGGGAKSSGFFDMDDNFNLQNEAGGVAKFTTASLTAARSFAFPDVQNNQAIFNITVANATIKGKTSAQTVTSLNAATTGEYIVGCGLLVNSVTLKTIKLQVQFNDENNTLQTIDLFPQGLTNAIVSTAGMYLYPSVSVSCTSGSNINVLVTQVVAGTSINYDAWATVVQAH